MLAGCGQSRQADKMTVALLWVNQGPRAAASPSTTAQHPSSRGLRGAPRPPLRWPWGQGLKAFLPLSSLLRLSVPAWPRPEAARRSCPCCSISQWPSTARHGPGTLGTVRGARRDFGWCWISVACDEAGPDALLGQGALFHARQS
jgi:hypothetical protein